MKKNKIKKQLLILALTCSALLTLTNPAIAVNYKVGDVLYCEGESGAFVEKPEFKFTKWSMFNFKFKILNKSIIKFGSGGHFSDSEYKIQFLAGDLLEAYDFDSGSVFNLYQGRFTHGSANVIAASMMTGRCDKF